MRHHRLSLGVATALAILSIGLGAAAAPASDKSADPTTGKSAATAKNSTERGAHGRKLDRSGRARVGKASFYAKRFAGRKMADGARMDPAKPAAASKTLPLGTVAKVTNLETGQSTTVTIRDRGPYVDGRIVDLSPAAAREIGLAPKQGVAPVEVAPIAVPTADGGVKPGEGAKVESVQDASRQDPDASLWR